MNTVDGLVTNVLRPDHKQQRKHSYARCVPGTCGLESPPSTSSPRAVEQLRPTLPSGVLWTGVRAAERVIAGITLVVLSPALLAIVVVVALLSRRPPIVAHRRVGFRGRDIWIFKIRTMWDRERGLGAPRQVIEYLPGWGLVPDSKLQPDPRVTSSFASLCRRYSIDEWPQLLQIVSGTLALIGPRPLTAAELKKHYGSASLRLAQVKPGLVGLWQVRGRNRLTYRERRQLDLFMLENWSLRLYIWILFASIPAVLSGRNAC